MMSLNNHRKIVLCISVDTGHRVIRSARVIKQGYCQPDIVETGTQTSLVCMMGKSQLRKHGQSKEKDLEFDAVIGSQWRASLKHAAINRFAISASGSL